MAADLATAAVTAYGKIIAKAASNALASSLTGFATAASPSFLDTIPNDRPVGNWFIPIQALTAAAGVRGTLAQQAQAGNLLYRICFAGSAMLAAGLITNTQATALLNAFNTYIE